MNELKKIEAYVPDFRNPAEMVLLWQENERLKKQLSDLQDEFQFAKEAFRDSFTMAFGYVPEIPGYSPYLPAVKAYLEGKNITCTAEIWDKCLNKKMDGFDKYTSREVNEALRILGGWRQTNSTKNFKGYGKQKYWKRV
jgi:hypothetical protein